MDESAGENQLRGNRNADESRQEVADSNIASGGADFDERGIHFGGLSGQPNIRRQSQGEPASARCTTYQADNNLGAAPHFDDDVAQFSLDQKVVYDASGFVLTREIETGTKNPGQLPLAQRCGRPD